MSYFSYQPPRGPRGFYHGSIVVLLDREYLDHEYSIIKGWYVSADEVKVAYYIRHMADRVVTQPVPTHVSDICTLIANGVHPHARYYYKGSGLKFTIGSAAPEDAIETKRKPIAKLSYLLHQWLKDSK